MEPNIDTPVMEKFTKANAYEYLNELAKVIVFADEDNEKLFLSEIKANFEPQAGGGASKNPSYMAEDGVTMMHYCRFKQEFRPESEMNMFNGKSKGASSLAAKHDYELGKKVAKLKADALEKFKAGEYAEGAELSTGADELDATRAIAATFADENLVQYIKDEKPTEDTANAGTNEADESAVDTDEKEV